MISGFVTSELDPVIDLEVKGTGRRSRIVRAIVDTGFSGMMTLSPELVDELCLTWRYLDSGNLADGSAIPVDCYDAHVRWDGKFLPIVVGAMGRTPLVGMDLLDGYQLTVRAIAGGRLTIERLTEQSL